MTNPGVRAAARYLCALCALLLVAACSPATLLNAFVPSDGYSVRHDLAYGDGERQRLDLYLPAEGPERAPVVVYFYGGSWKSGSREAYRFIGEALARQGFIVAIPDYRLYPEVRFPAFVEDGARAVGWLSTHAPDFGGDPDRLILMGHSAGAHIAALLAFDRRYLGREAVPKSSIRGLVGVAGPYAFDPLAYDSTKPIFTGLGKPEQARPITFAANGSVDTLLLHGADDTTVLPRNSRDFASRIQNSGGQATVLEYPEIGHIKIILSFAAPFRGRDSVYQDTIDFLRSL